MIDPPSKDTMLLDHLAAAGVDRRRFLAWCSAMAGVLAMPRGFGGRIAEAVTAPGKPSVIWFEFQDCTGDTESFLRARNPSVGEILLDLLSVDYHETLMTPSGQQAEASLDQAIDRGKYLVVVEGSVPLGEDGAYCVIAGRSAKQHLERAAKGALAVINVGTCSAYGGLPAARPNPTGAVAVSDVISGVPMINLPGCPANADNITATIVHYLTTKQLPPTDDLGRPLFAYGDRIHDNCPRRGHFDAGRFALAWGDEGHRSGWCLYKLGCKGPSTWHNCPSQQWNGHTSWPIAAGHGCVGCTEPRFWDTMTPIYDRLPHVTGAGLDLTAERIGLTVVGAAAVGFAAHGVGKAIQHRVARRGNGATAADGSPPDGTGPDAGRADGTSPDAAPPHTTGRAGHGAPAVEPGPPTVIPPEPPLSRHGALRATRVPPAAGPNDNHPPTKGTRS